MSFIPVLHSVSYAGWWGQQFLALDPFIDKAAELGFQGVMLMAKRPHLSILDYGPGERARLRERLEARGMRQVIVAAYNNFTADWEHAEIPHREIQIQYLTDLSRLTADIGGKLIRIFTAYEHPGAGYTAAWNATVAAIRECARRASEFGVTIGVQNHHDIGCGYESQFDMIEAVNEPNCKALFDAWAPALHQLAEGREKPDLTAAARKLAPITAHTTVANYQLRPRFAYEPAVVNYQRLTPYAQAVPIDEGFIDYAHFLGDLAAGGFQGSVAYEMCSPLAGGGGMENLDRYARRFVEFMQRLV